MKIIMRNPKCKYSKRANYTKFDNYTFLKSSISNIIKVFAKFSNPLFKYKILKYND